MAIGRKTSVDQWGFAWIGLAGALALHVTDEALTGFLPLYNHTVETIRETIPWFPYPTFTFTVWLTGLITLILVLLALSPLVFKGHAWLRPISYVLAVIMVANSIGHTAASLYWGTLVPGVHSSPVLLMAAVILIIKAWRAQTDLSSKCGA